MNDHTTAAQPLDLDKLEALARAADKDGDQHIYTHWRDSNNWRANEAWHAAASPGVFLALIVQARAAQPESAAAPKDTPESMAESNARFAIDGAIQYGRENRNAPPSADHWLYEYWNIGQQLRELGKTGWDNVTPLASQPPARSSCTSCDGSGTVHRADGEYMGECPCAGSAPSATGTTGASIDTPEFKELMRGFYAGPLSTGGAVEYSQVVAHIDATIGDLRAQLAATTENLQTAVQEAWEANAELSKLRAAPASAQPDRGAAQGNECERCEDGYVYNTDHNRRMPCRDCAPSPASQPVAPALSDCLNALRTAWHVSGVVQGRQDIADAIKRGESALAAVAPSDAKGKAVPPMPKRWQDRRDEYPKYEQPCADFLIEQEMKEWREWGAKIAESATGKADAANAGGLLPCAFCGDGEPVLMPNEGPQGIGRSIGHPHTDTHYVHCDNCGADGPAHLTEYEARSAWNSRASQSPATSAADAKDAARLEWISLAWGGQRPDYSMHVLQRGGNGDLSDIRTFVDAAIAAAQQGGAK